jgi:AcrR family transcriptional regulator
MSGRSVPKVSKNKAIRPRQRLRVEDRRAQLVELGLRAFTERPYDEVSIDEIAAEAGISRGLLFHYFASKHAYYVAVLSRAAETLVQGIAEAAVGSAVGERLAAGLRAYFHFVGERAETYAALLRGGVGSDPVVQAVVERTRQTFIDTLREGLAAYAPGLDPTRLRAALRGWIGLVEALALDWIDRRELPVDELVTIALRAFAVVVPGLGAHDRSG